MKIEDYKEFIKTTAIYPKDCAIEYLLLGLIGEAGELCNTYKKVLRDNLPESEWVPKFKKELGDFFWYLYQLGNEDSNAFNTHLVLGESLYENETFIECLLKLNLEINTLINWHIGSVVFRGLSRNISLIIYHFLNSSIEEILQMNVDKLQSRKERGVLGGSGDER